jgi:hypothetical protein
MNPTQIDNSRGLNMNEDQSKPLDAVVIPTLFWGKLKYQKDETAAMVYFESINDISSALRRNEIPRGEINIGIPIHIDLKTIKLTVERFFKRGFEKGAQIYSHTKLIPNQSVTEIWKTIGFIYWNNSGPLKEKAKEAYKKSAEMIKEIAKKDKKNKALLEELETFLALCVSVSDKTHPLNPNVVKQLLPT